MTSFQKNFVACLEQRGLSLGQLAVITGLNKSTLSRYKNGLSEPNSDKIETLCRALKITPSELVGYSTPITSAEYRLVEDFRSLSPDGQAQLLNYMAFLQTQKKDITRTSTASADS